MAQRPNAAYDGVFDTSTCDTWGDPGEYARANLVLLFTNDLPSFIRHGHLIMYADDAQFIDADAPVHVGDLRVRVEHTLETVLNWFTQNRLKIDPSKRSFSCESKTTSIRRNI